MSDFITFRVEKILSSLPLETGSVSRRRARVKLLDQSEALGEWKSLLHTALNPSVDKEMNWVAYLIVSRKLLGESINVNTCMFQWNSEPLT